MNVLYEDPLARYPDSMPVQSATEAVSLPETGDTANSDIRGGSRKGLYVMPHPQRRASGSQTRRSAQDGRQQVILDGIQCRRESNVQADVQRAGYGYQQCGGFIPVATTAPGNRPSFSCNPSTRFMFRPVHVLDVKLLQGNVRVAAAASGVLRGTSSSHGVGL